jgi:hypothetical protein
MQDGAPPGTPFFCSPEVVIPLKGFDLFASDIETCKHVSASLGSFVIPATFVIPDPVPGGNLPFNKKTLATLLLKMTFARVEKVLERLYIIWAKTCTFLRGCL